MGWINFTWFASAYDTDDVPYRLLTLLQITGVLVLAAGVPAAFEEYDYTTVTVGYLVMRVGLLGQWLRVAAEHPEGRVTALRYVVGYGVVQLAWIGRLALPDPWGGVGFGLLVAAELAVPVWAERSGPPSSWHPGHIAERYGLFTLIVLGECVLAATTAVQTAIAAGGVSGSLLVLATGGLLLIFGTWWTYFARPAVDGLRSSSRSAFGWGYGHYAVFAAVAALGAGLQVAAETVQHETHLGPGAAAYAVGVPVATYLVVIGLLHTQVSRRRPVGLRVLVPAAVLVLLLPAGAGLLGLPAVILAMGLVVAALATLDVVTAHRTSAGPAATTAPSRRPRRTDAGRSGPGRGRG